MTATGAAVVGAVVVLGGGGGSLLAGTPETLLRQPMAIEALTNRVLGKTSVYTRPAGTSGRSPVPHSSPASLTCEQLFSFAVAFDRVYTHELVGPVDEKSEHATSPR